MIPYQLDPTLHPTQPAPPQLDDGCSPPAATKAASPAEVEAGDAVPVDPSLWAKSEF